MKPSKIRKKVQILFWKIKFQLALLSLAIVTIIAFIPVFTYFYFANDLQSKESIMNKNNTGLVLLDRKERPFFTFYEAEYKDLIPLSKIPKHTQQAVIAIEDKEFYKHQGFSIRGILRSLFLDIREGEIAYGGSTITQQLVKNALLTSKRSFLRKYQEIVLAQEIERRYTKTEIMEMYLNSVYFGEGAFGIDQASKAYFGKNVSQLTVAESALLAGILPAPSRYSPLSGEKELAKRRQLAVLDAMQQEKYITDAQHQAARTATLSYVRAKDDMNSIGTHFALMVRKQLADKYGEEQISRSGFRVKTTLDIEWQEYAEEIVAQQVEKLAVNKVSNGAAVVIDPGTGEVRVLVGSKDWFNEEYGKFNVADSARSPGSAFKPIIYAAALEKRLITPSTPLHDRPTTFQGNYKPQNYDRNFRGTVLTRRALANSLNVPSVEIMAKLGVPAGLEMAKRLGLTTLKDPSNYGLSLVLGTAEVKLLELTNAYATFANQGMHNPIASVLTITDKSNKVIYQHTPNPEQVVDAGVTFLISSILSDAKARQEVFGSALNVPLPAAVKTGTGEDYKDALTVGYTPRLAVGVWVGNNNSVPMDKIAGSLGAAPIWRQLIERFSRGTPIAQFEKPANVTSRSICRYNGLLVRSNTMPAQTEYFLAGTEPTRYCVMPKPTPPPEDMPSEPSENNENKEKEEREKKDKENGRGGNIDQLQEEINRQVEEQIRRQLEEVQQQLQQEQGQAPSASVQ